MQRMQPLHDWPASARQSIVGVFTDIDDTLTTHGHITPDALQGLEQLKAAGLHVIAITGRPIGWCERLARGDADAGHAPWPLDAVVAENGAVAWVGSTANRSKIYQQEAAVRARMRSVANRVTSQIPAAQITRDSDGRETDLAFDAAEFAQLTPQEIAQVVAIMEAEGMHTTVSSIHIHGCYGVFNKWRGACWIVQQLLGRRLEDEIGQWVFVGDSGNDVAMFEHFEHSAGVANLRHVADQLSHLPRYLAASERGAGFSEVAAAILQARQP
jgi:hypothetical protein